MISDESDEDADAQDDDIVLDTFLGPDAAERDVRGARAHASPGLQDWPASHLHELDATVDVETLAWFKSNYADWRAAMGAVLRAWVEART